MWSLLSFDAHVHRFQPPIFRGASFVSTVRTTTASARLHRRTFRVGVGRLFSDGRAQQISLERLRHGEPLFRAINTFWPSLATVEFCSGRSACNVDGVAGFRGSHRAEALTRLRFVLFS